MGLLSGEGGFWCCGGPFLTGGAPFFPKLFKHRLDEFGFLKII